MRTYEFETKSKSKIKLGEVSTSICFLKEGKHFEPAILCIETEVENSNTLLIRTTGLIYWNRSLKDAVRRNFTFEEANAMSFSIMLDNNSDVQQREKTIEELKEYYISMEKMCCALEVGCVTEKMKTQYREILGFNADETSKKMEEIFLKAFPDAMEIIMH